MRIAACALTNLLVSTLFLKADLLSVDLERAPLDDYTETDLLTDWAGANVFQGVDEGSGGGRVSIVADPIGGSNKVLEVRYPSGASASADSGASWV